MFIAWSHKKNQLTSRAEGEVGSRVEVVEVEKGEEVALGRGLDAGNGDEAVWKVEKREGGGGGGGGLFGGDSMLIQVAPSISSEIKV